MEYKLKSYGGVLPIENGSHSELKMTRVHSHLISILDQVLQHSDYLKFKML